ncbi:MAG: hypothetical protein HY600_06870 [Candidatus Omnitrophica bacterium]|nr:hypothetical protein [Candidatus Omnitrophota bacterium]
MMWTAVGFFAVGALARFIPHPPNLTPLTAMALFAGAWLPMPVALVLAVGALFVGDLALGWGPQNLLGYVALGLTVLLGARLRSRWRPLAIGGATLSGSLLFYLLSNFGVWLEGLLYPRTGAGLVACYVAGIPFYRWQLVGDLAYTALLFGGFSLVCRWRRWSPTLSPRVTKAVDL